MTRAIEIRPLTRDDDRSAFSCGQDDLDRFFEHYAGQNQFKLHLAVTYVAVVGKSIVGFATVAASSIERASVPGARLQRRLPAYPLPILRLARLGVDLRAQGQGIGGALMHHVLHLALEQRERLGCVGIVTDAKPEAVGYYQDLGFEIIGDVRQGLLHGEPPSLFLAMDTIAATIGESGS